MERRIETERLILRPLQPGDARDVYEFAGDPRVNRFMPYALYTGIEQAQRWIASQGEDSDEFAFQLKSTGKVIGTGSVGLEKKDGLFHLGYNLNYDYWGRGYATEAARAMIRWAYECKGARDFSASRAVANTASGRVLEKCGFRPDHSGQYSKFDGSEIFDALYYRLHLD